MTNQSKLDNPFVGLRAFEEDEDYLFFGRSAEINDLLVKFAASRFLAVIGSSGSGKSSLVKSGLVPAIHSGFLSSGHNWHVALMRPENKPIENLAIALSKKGVLNNAEATVDGIPYQPIIESTLRRSTNGLIEAYNQSSYYNKSKSEQTENLLIIVDQFEELFRFSKDEKEVNKGESQSLKFVNLLLTAAAETQTEFPVYVLLTMRSDFLGDCSQFRGLPEAINKGQYLVPRMTRDEIKEAITGPIAIGGAEISQSLITRLLNDIGNDIDQLPIFQHAMMRTWNVWKKRNQPNDPINLEDYLGIGGMASAMSDHANEVYDNLSPEENKKYCELMFKALTDKAADVRGIRRPRSVNVLSELAQAPPGNIISIVEEFRKTGRTFLMPPLPAPLAGSTVIDISHESIMRVWDKLKTWTEEEARCGDIYLRLSNSAILYEQGQRGLLRNPELEIALKWKKNYNPTSKWAEGFKVNFEEAMAYLEQSNQADILEKKTIADREAEEARRKRSRVVSAIISLSLFGLIVSGISVYTFILKGIADKAKEDAYILLNNLRKSEYTNVNMVVTNITKRADTLLAHKDALAKHYDAIYSRMYQDALDSLDRSYNKDTSNQEVKKLRDSVLTIITKSQHLEPQN